MCDLEAYSSSLSIAVSAFEPYLPTCECVRSSAIVLSRNKRNTVQERVLVVTTRHVYRIKYDFARGEVLHIKSHPLIAIGLVEIGLFDDLPGFRFHTRSGEIRSFTGQTYMLVHKEALECCITEFATDLHSFASRAASRAALEAPELIRGASFTFSTKSSFLGFFASLSGQQIWNRGDAATWPPPTLGEAPSRRCTVDCRLLHAPRHAGEACADSMEEGQE